MEDQKFFHKKNMDTNVEKEPVDFLKHLLKEPTKKKSRKVTEDDMDILKRDGHILYNLCFTQIGIYPGALAMHHSQINDEDPLDFFVTNKSEIIINPVMVNHTKVPVERKEGCLSFGMNPPVIVSRYNKATFKYDTTDGAFDKFTSKEENMCGIRAQMFQHETDHGQAKYIYKIK